jgi:Ca2+-binding RTX toxin-like protein
MSRPRAARFLPAAFWIAPLALALTASPASAAVVVTDAAAFVVAIDNNDAVSVDCSGGFVRVFDDGVPTTYTTTCAAVTTLTVTATGVFDNTINLSGVTAAAFTALSPTVTTVSVAGGGGVDVLTGSELADAILGGPGSETQLGGAGNDVFTWNPGDGNDTLLGDAGTDTLVFNGSGGAEVFAVSADGTGFDFTRDLGNIVMDVETVEQLILNGLGGNDSATVGNLAGVADLTTISLLMGDGDDTVNASAQANAAIALTIVGGADNDNLTGSPNADTISGGVGNDTIVGLGGVDVMDGGDGDDAITGGPGNETQPGGAGNDTFIWNPGDGSDTLLGGAGTDTMVFNGSGGNEVFAVSADGTGFDFTRDLGNIVMDVETVETLTLNGLAGNDSATVGNLTGVVDLTAINLLMGDGDDTVNASAQANAAIALVIDGGTGNDNLTGSPNIDEITGGPGNDTIVGLGGVDVMDGGDGDDAITGGPGNETQLGGAGNDTFTWNPGDGSDTLLGGAGADTMVFNGSGAAEVFAVVAEGTGFDFTRDVGNIIMDADEIEALILNALGGDDLVTTVGLAGTSQSLSGGSQTTADVLNINAQGQCAVGSSSSGTLTIAGAQPISFTEFEQVNVQNQCITDVPTLSPLAMAALAAFLVLAALVVLRLQSPA